MDDLISYASSMIKELMELWIFVASLSIVSFSYAYIRRRVSSQLHGCIIFFSLLFVAFSFVSFSVWQKEYHLRLAIEQKTAAHNGEVVKAAPFVDQIMTFPEAQAKALMLAAEKRKEAISPLVVGIFGAKNIAYSKGIVDAFRKAGVKTSSSIITPDTSLQSGILISCDKSDESSKKKEALADILEKAGLESRATDMLDEAKEQGIKGCLLYIGPDHN